MYDMTACGLVAMPKKKLSEQEKKEKRRKQQREWVRKKRAKLNETQLQERRQADREKYKKKKELGLVKSIKDLTPRAQRQVRKQWRERTQKHRERKKLLKESENILLNETPPSSPAPSSSRSSRLLVGRRIAERNRLRLRNENVYLRQRVLELEKRVSRYRMRLCRKDKGTNKISIEVPEQVVSKKKNKTLHLKAEVRKFLERDDSSRLTSGKKETITKKKQKKQIRLLNETMIYLYQKFKEETGIKISYSLFCRNRPFWVIIPDAKKRNTCMCLTHANMDFLVASLNKSKIINASTSNKLIKSICCHGHLKVPCLMKQCESCKNKSLVFNRYHGEETITCERWINKKTPIVINNVTKLCQRTIKESFVTTKSFLVKTLEEKLPAFMQHIATIINQYKTVSKIKRTLSKNEALLHIDFAENYLCKYAEEVQSAHFGASKPQISLHTSVLYLHGDSKESIQSFCSISKNLRHDPVLICAHLKPVFDLIKEKIPNIKTMHFQSDGPTNQYKNKSMFYLLAKYIGAELGAENILWHFSESGHGKGAPDGIGAVVKRTADAHVATGRDVSDYDKLMSCLQEKCNGVRILPIDDNHINHIESILEKNATLPFKGTLSIRQLSWSKTNPDVIHARNFSCDVCIPGQICSHHEIGIIFLNSRSESVENSPSLNEITHDTPVKETCANTSRSLSPSLLTMPICDKKRKRLNFYELCYGSDDSEFDSDNVDPPKRSPLRDNVNKVHERKKDSRVSIKIQSKCSRKARSEDGENVYEAPTDVDLDGLPGSAKRKRRFIPKHLKNMNNVHEIENISQAPGQILTNDSECNLKHHSDVKNKSEESGDIIVSAKRRQIRLMSSSSDEAIF